MYPASNAFHAAVQNHNPQKILLIFPDAVFSNEDVDVESGVEFQDDFNLEEDTAIGQTPSNEISFSLFNDFGDLNEYEFGEFTATLGVRLTSEAYTETGTCSAIIGSDVYTGHDTAPYVKKNGTALGSQPGFPVRSLLVMDETVYAIGPDGLCFRYVNGSGSGYALNAFMKRKMSRKEGYGLAYKSSTRILTERYNGTEKTYEFVPFGVFEADRPNVPDVIKIDFTCNDRMTKLNKDMPKASELGITYPTTIGTLFEKICQYFQVPYLTSTFINSDGGIAKEPDEFSNTTAKAVIGWIAEAACCNAVFNRDGLLELKWIKETGVRIDETGYVEFNPYWYETTKVDKVLNRDTQSSTDKSHGSGEVSYLIQDNPLLKGFA